jgi:flagellar motility protein MotE (MotC chaperone)
VQYVVVFLVTSAAAVLLVVLAMTFAPSLFSSGEVTPPGPQQADTSAHQNPAPQVTLARQDTAPAPVQAARAHLDDTLHTLQDTIAALRQRLDAYASSASKESRPAGVEVSPEHGDSLQLADSLREAEARTIARVFDAMKAENAARIMGGLADEEVRTILLAVKQRQAAKILAALEPERAARIIR